MLPPHLPYTLFSPLCPCFSCPLLLVTACRHLHYCTCITVIWLFIWLKTKVVKGLGLYLARIGQCLAQNRHSGSIYWILLLWIENGIWHYFGHCVAGIMEWKGLAHPIAVNGAGLVARPHPRGMAGRRRVASGLWGCDASLYQWPSGSRSEKRGK